MVVRQRARDHGIAFGELPVGAHNAITDVPDITVGSVALCARDGEHAVRTGVTVVVPRPGSLLTAEVPAACHVINGHGKPAGLAQVHELGVIETPIAMTSTLSVGDAFRGLVLDALRRDPAVRSVNPVVLECNDGLLNDSPSLPVTAEDVLAAIDEARSGPVAEGNAGAGMGMSSFGWKSGIGSASRVVRYANREGTIGTLVLSNFGYPRDLMIRGCDVGMHLPSPATPDRPGSAGSFVAVVATDLPLDSRQLGRLARRVQSGIARVGGYVGNTSGEFVVALSVTSSSPAHDADGLDVVFHAVVDTTEEAIVNSMFCATAVTGVNGTTVPELPIGPVLTLLRERGVLA
jgi:D-aminopeptidase